VSRRRARVGRSRGRRCARGSSRDRCDRVAEVAQLQRREPLGKHRQSGEGGVRAQIHQHVELEPEQLHAQLRVAHGRHIDEEVCLASELGRDLVGGGDVGDQHELDSVAVVGARDREEEPRHGVFAEVAREVADAQATSAPSSQRQRRMGMRSAAPDAVSVVFVIEPCAFARPCGEEVAQVQPGRAQRRLELGGELLEHRERFGHATHGAEQHREAPGEARLVGA
jgi:hypothetical protein